MDEALRASDTGSAKDFWLNILDAAVKGDSDRMADQIDGWTARYAADNEHSLPVLKGFIPLIPALKDPANPDHAKALDWFAKSSDWITMQWVFARNANLSTADTIRFFGGTKTDWTRQFIVLALLKDKDTFEKKYEINRRSWRHTHQELKARILVFYLRNELLGIPVPADQPDLKPADWMPFNQRILSSLGKDH